MGLPMVRVWPKPQLQALLHHQASHTRKPGHQMRKDRDPSWDRSVLALEAILNQNDRVPWMDA